jgi:ATP-dependent DNA ligase
MQTRLHPAESRIRRLSAEIPAEYVVFDMLLWDGEPVWQLPLAERRARVEALQGFRLSPATRKLADARAWLDRFEALGLDGVIGKRLDAAYLPGSRDAVVKVKEHRTADCVIVGFRWSDKEEGKIATLLLGLYKGDSLEHVGHASGLPAKIRKELEVTLPALAGESALQGERRPGGQSRWSAGKELDWVPVRPELVCEVRYDKLQGNRFRHGTRFLRLRPDKEPAECTWAQVEPAKQRVDPVVADLLR